MTVGQVDLDAGGVDGKDAVGVRNWVHGCDDLSGGELRDLAAVQGDLRRIERARARGQLLCDWARLGSVEAMGWRAWGRGRVDRGGGDEVTAKVGCAHGGCVDVAGLVEEGRSFG
ncbi:hypothetical protein M0R45_006048 [Rubus argutus]|uniref:MHC class I antigen n=1 Tax=Rubus argutus TaxID=59490 RepID=A0AAW1YPU4_RUBAR